MKLLQINGSARRVEQGALSTLLANELSAALLAARPGSRATVRDLAAQLHPALDEAALDAWEGTALGLWRKIRVRVDTMNASVLAWLYVLDDYEGGLPSARYLGIMADAAEALADDVERELAWE